MKSRLLFFYSFAILLFLWVGCQQKEVSWPDSSQQVKPWTRWWWPGNAVDRENIRRELQEMAGAGIGGIEITSIYGVKGEEKRFIPYLSPEFSEILQYTIEAAHELGMGVDIPPGSGWRCGGPFVPEEKGQWSLKMHRFPVEAGEKWQLPDGIKNPAAVSFLETGGESEVLDPETPFVSPSGGIVYVAERVKNPDKVKRAAEGGKGWAVDTYDEEITSWYLEEIWERMAIEEGKIRCFFHDSYEYTGDFTREFFRKFKQRRGYDLAEYLYVLAGDCQDTETVARIKSDYRETLSELVLEAFIEPMTAWANEHQSLNRNQAHGSPGNILDLYAACDIPETEIFKTVEPGSVNVFVNKFASSAAHVTGQELVSSESYTWLEEHWTVTPSDMLRATNRFFLSGINHLFFHGTCYSPKDTEWPGWLFYASTQVNNRNPLWREFPALFKFIERSQSVLQRADQLNDLLVYWPYYDVAASGGPVFKNLGVNQQAGWFEEHPIAPFSQKLMDAGYTFDYISDRQLLNCQVADGQVLTSGETAYKAVVLPQTKYIPLQTMKKLNAIIADGGKVFFDAGLPESVPGIHDLEKRETQLAELKSAVDVNKHAGNVKELLAQASVPGEQSLSESGFHFLKMENNGEVVYMVFNCSTTALDEWVQLNIPAREYVFLDPWNGKITTPQQKKQAVRLQMEPETSLFIRCMDSKTTAPDYAYMEPSAETEEIEGTWKVRFIEGGPVFPGDISLAELDSWTRTGDPQASRFAGTARYSVEFDHSRSFTSGVLDLGEVKDCARVKLNGKSYGMLPGPSFKVKVDNLQPGKNQLEVDVTNVAANRIRDLDIKGENWKKFYDINFVNIDYEPFDASEWEIRDAGLLGPVNIHAVN